MYRTSGFVAPPTVSGTMKTLGLAVSPPPATNPQVYAQNYSCPVPNIQVYQRYPYSQSYA